MERASLIERIVAERRKRHEEVQARLDTVNAVCGRLEALKDLSTAYQSRLADNVKVCSLLRELDAKLGEARTQASALGEELRRLKNRTSRDTLNIGVVGKPKQGKSTFLQALTGLEEAIIPTGGDYVTGACSYLRHDPAVAPGNAYAIITPYSRHEFKEEVLKPFCQKFHLELDTLEDLPRLQLPDEATLSQREKIELERLRGLKAGFADYKDLLDRSSLRIPKGDIRRYVAQCDESTDKKYTNWYAVKRAEIHCCFPQADIGSVTICDTPGLGDFTPGARSALLEKLSMDMDVVFFLKRPQPGKETIEEEDAEFYDVIKQANPLFEVPDWAYMLLNCPSSDHVSSIFENNLNAKLRTRLDVMQVDAKDKDAVSTAFDVILRDVVEQIPNLDGKLMTSYAKRLEDLRRRLADVVRSASSVFTFATGPGGGIEVHADANCLVSELFESILSYKEELNNGSLGSLAPDIDAVIKSMRDNPPELAYNALAAAAPIKWYGDCKDMLRARFIREFSHLDVSMQKLVDKVRDRLQEILVTTGRLSFVCTEGGNFWADARELLQRELGEHASPLCQAIDNVTGISLNFRAFILPRLTEVTNGLSNAPLPPKSPFECFALSPHDDIKTAANKLKSAWTCAVSAAEGFFDPDDGALQDVCSTPAAAMTAMLDEFWLLWARYGGEKHATSVWCNFYASHAREVWPEKYEGDASLVAIARTWISAVDALADNVGKLR